VPESVTSTSLAPNAATLGRRALHGLVWMLAQNVAARACSLVSQLVLASLLLPAEFGLIGLTYTVTSVAATLTNIGIEDVLMQRQRALRLWTGAAFWIILGLASLAGLLVVAASPLAAAAYKAPELVGLLAVAALAMPINALASVPGMIMRSRMQFGTLAAYGTLEMFAQSLLTVIFAWAGLGAYSFVIPAPILAVARALVFWRLANSGVSLRPMRKRWKYVVNNTAAVFLTRIIVTFINQGDYIVLGLIATQDVVGGYYFGFRLAAQPLWILAGNFSGVIFPALAQLKGDPKRQGDAALKASNLLSFCVMPLAMLQAAAAAPLVISLFGDKWLTSVPIIQLLSIGLAFDAVSWIAGSLLNARGEFVAGLRYMMIQAPLFFLLVTIGAKLDQAIGVAWAVCAFYAISQPIYVWAAYRRLGIGARAVAMIYLRPTAYAGVAVGLGLLASMPPWFDAHQLLRVLVIGVVGTGLYAVLVRWLAAEVWGELRDRAIGALRR
jgi:PST family polysaccharide transporter